MKKEEDIYCERIFMVITIKGKIRFNQLYNALSKYNAQMSKPTLAEHLNHLVKRKIVKRVQEAKQKVTYDLNWKRFEQLKEAGKTYGTALTLVRNENNFKSMSLNQQAIFTTAMLTTGELYYLKLMVLDILEPESRLHNYFSHTFIRKLYNTYAEWFLDSCKKSEGNGQRALKMIDKSIATFRQAFFEITKEDAQDDVLRLRRSDLSDRASAGHG